MKNSRQIQDTLCLHLKGQLIFWGSPSSNFVGPIKKGLRLVLWGNSDKRATSCVFINDVEFINGEKAEAEIIILSSLSIDRTIDVGASYSIGIPGIKLADFKIGYILGQWNKEIPSLTKK